MPMRTYPARSDIVRLALRDWFTALGNLLARNKDEK